MTTVELQDVVTNVGEMVSVAISLRPEGGETNGSWGLRFDKTILEFQGASPGKDAPARITINYAPNPVPTTLGGFGMNFLVSIHSPFTQSPTPAAIIVLTFKALKAGVSAINFESSVTPQIPTKKSIGNNKGGLVTAVKWMDGSVTVN